VPVSHRPLAIVSGLTIGDYLLWNWSLNANHDVLALVSGLTLPPLAIACVWLIAVTVARLLARTTRGSARRRSLMRPSAKGAPARAQGEPARAYAAGALEPLERSPVIGSPAPSSSSSSRSSRKIAA
jgi:hypothetical protein